MDGLYMNSTPELKTYDALWYVCSRDLVKDANAQKSKYLPLSLN